jgi:hypothetical protein
MQGKLKKTTRTNDQCHTQHNDRTYLASARRASYAAHHVDALQKKKTRNKQQAQIVTGIHKTTEPTRLRFAAHHALPCVAAIAATQQRDGAVKLGAASVKRC